MQDEDVSKYAGYSRYICGYVSSFLRCDQRRRVSNPQKQLEFHSLELMLANFTKFDSGLREYYARNPLNKSGKNQYFG